MAKLARLNIAAMNTAGLSVIDLPFKMHSTSGSWDWLYHHMHPGEGPLAKGRRVAYWVWEKAGYLPDTWLDASADFEQIWVPSDFVCRNLVKGGVDPLKLKVIPPYATFGGMVSLSKVEHKFITVIEGRDLHRANPWGVVKAFKLAFQNHEPVTLTVKLGGMTAQDLKQCQKALGGDNRISVIEATLDERVTRELLKDHSACVSLHRTDGVCSALLEAASLGVPIIAPLYGGNEEYCTPHTCYPVGYETTDAPGGGTWIEPDPQHAAIQMHSLFQNLRSDYVRQMTHEAYRLALLKCSYLNTVTAIQQAVASL